MPKIIIIDDEENILKALRRMLIDCDDYEVFTYSDPRQGMQAVMLERPEVLVVDMLMPDVDGIEICTSIRKMGSPPRVIAISGGGSIEAEEYLYFAKKIGVSETLAKPFQDTDLIAAIKRCL